MKVGKRRTSSRRKKNVHIESAPKLVVSVLLTDDLIEEGIKVNWSDRKDPTYDGIIEYSNGLILIIENKPDHGDVSREQLSPNINSFPSELVQKDSLHPWAVCVVWSEVLEGVLRFINSKFAHLGSSEIASDFLTFVEEIHPELTPYRTFRLCAGRPESLKRRIDKLHRDIVTEVRNRRSEESDCEFSHDVIYRKDRIAQQIRFDCKNNQHLRVRLWPANTTAQLRRLHEFFEENGNEEFLKLANSGQWTLNNLLRFFSLHNAVEVWAEPNLPTDYYLAYFADGENIGQWRYEAEEGRGNLEEFLHQLQNNKFINERELVKIEEGFFAGNRTRMNVAPGFAIYRKWSLDEVIQWEENLTLVDKMIKELNNLLAAWGEEL